MKSRLTHCLLTSCVGGMIAIAPLAAPIPAPAQSTPGLSYSFYGRTIPLRVRPDTVGVQFKPTGQTRGGGLPYLRLQRDLQGGGNTRGGTRGGVGPQVQVQPFGASYAVVMLPPARTRGGPADVTQRVQRLPYVQQTLPVLTRRDRDEMIVLPNEIVLSLRPNVDEAGVQALLQRYNLEILRPVPFTQNQYVVRSRTLSGTAILGLANQLNNAPGVRSASPNFIQSVPYQIQGQSRHPSTLTATPNAASALQDELRQLPGPVRSGPFPSKLLPLQWHLDSRPKRGQALPRTDIRAVEAWQQAQNDGEGVVVAVIDSLIQWDHPDLATNVYDVGQVDDPLPGEKHGWDFAQNDPDTRLSADELKIIRPVFQDSFQLAPPALLQKYPNLAQQIQFAFPNEPNSKLAQRLRNYLRNMIAAEFHGTWSAGVIAANAGDGTGVMGVAPRAKILPIRVFGLGGAITVDSLLGAVRYAAARKADVINLSLGGLLPAPGEVETFFEVLDQIPIS